jgi:hypothetical protein
MTVRTERAIPLNKPRAWQTCRRYAITGRRTTSASIPPKSNICTITRLTQEPDLNLVHQQFKALRAKLAHVEALLESAAARKAANQPCALFQKRRSYPYVR